MSERPPDGSTGSGPAGPDAPSYGSYLRLADLLAAQHPAAEPAVHDEMLFIIVHQAYELWFRLLLHELIAARDSMMAGDPDQALLLLERCYSVERLLVSQVDVLDTLPPARFLEFRPALGEASGLQSAQFREIEFLSGWKDGKFLGEWLTAAERKRLADRMREPSLWDAFLSVLARAGFDTGGPDARRDTLATLARDQPGQRQLWRLAEALLNHDQAWSLWRDRHALMVERQIGVTMGTGHSSGTPYLRSRPAHFFPELWEIRMQLAADAGPLSAAAVFPGRPGAGRFLPAPGGCWYWAELI